MQEERFDTALKAIGANIRRLRKDAKLTMEVVAHQSQIDFRQLGRIESGEGNVTVFSLFRIADVLKVDYRKFFE